MSEPNIEIAAVIGKFIKTDGTVMAMARLINAPEFNFNADFVAAACVTLYETYLHSVPESEQNKFENEFKVLFGQMFEQRYKYLSELKDEITHD